MTLSTLRSGQPVRPTGYPERNREPNSGSNSPHPSGPGFTPHTLSAFSSSVILPKIVTCVFGRSWF